jgi:truncated hemoglobin YjbI
MSDTIYEQIGGSAAVDAAVDLFYDKVLADDTINGFFQSVDMKKQRAKQKAFLTMVFGGRTITAATTCAARMPRSWRRGSAICISMRSRNTCRRRWTN